MNRRSFLQKTGIVVGGVVGLLVGRSRVSNENQKPTVDSIRFVAPLAAYTSIFIVTASRERGMLDSFEAPFYAEWSDGVISKGCFVVNIHECRHLNLGTTNQNSLCIKAKRMMENASGYKREDTIFFIKLKSEDLKAELKNGEQRWGRNLKFC